MNGGWHMSYLDGSQLSGMDKLLEFGRPAIFVKQYCPDMKKEDLGHQVCSSGNNCNCYAFYTFTIVGSIAYYLVFTI
ncbi:hypothetical protein AMTRI_Chr11g98570 [Amborella trichopoda]